MIQEKEQEFFQLVRTAFDPIKAKLEYGDLYLKLTPEDVDKLSSAFNSAVLNWIEFLKMARKPPQ